MDFDLNVDFNPSIPEISSSYRFLFDLNSEPYGVEDDTPLDQILDDQVEGSHQFGEAWDQLQEELQQWEDNNPGSQFSRTNRNLTNDERRAVYQMLLWKSVNGKLQKYTTREVASAFSISMRTVQRIWKQGKESPNDDVSIKRYKYGRKQIQLDLEQFRSIPLKKRTTISSIACELNISTTVLLRLLKDGAIRRHSNAIKPFLREDNKRQRLQFCLSMLEQNSIPHNPIFIGMYNVVHIDEKWFYMTKKNENYYLLLDENEPLRTCKSKNFIGKVMFLAAVARPRFNIDGNCIFSGKIGIFPFVTREPAKRRSANRPAGTMETKPINSVRREEIRAFLVEKVIPAIKEKWPAEDRMHPIYIQQDNARTHVGPNDYEVCVAARSDGFDIRLLCQPPNSPDLNILDLGFF